MDDIQILEGALVGDKFKCGMKFVFSVAIPAVQCEKYALLVEHDGLCMANVHSLKKLADEGKAPYTVCVGVMPAKMEVALYSS